MFFILILFLALLIVDIAAIRWGYDSRDTIASEEWAHRQQRGFPSVEVSYEAAPETRSLSQARDSQRSQLEYAPC